MKIVEISVNYGKMIAFYDQFYGKKMKKKNHRIFVPEVGLLSTKKYVLGSGLLNENFNGLGVSPEG